VKRTASMRWGVEPFLVELFNRCLSMGSVPTSFKAAYITPLLKKPDLDSADQKSYRPIANLSVLSKLLERLVVRQLLDHLNATRLLPELLTGPTTQPRLR